MYVADLHQLRTPFRDFSVVTILLQCYQAASAVRLSFVLLPSQVHKLPLPPFPADLAPAPQLPASASLSAVVIVANSTGNTDQSAQTTTAN